LASVVILMVGSGEIFCIERLTSSTMTWWALWIACVFCKLSTLEDSCLIISLCFEYHSYAGIRWHTLGVR
jgi:hypothetical protein